MIGSKSFTESHILGELMTLILAEHTGLKVEHRSGIGGTLLAFEALTAGEIDAYPEYSGTAYSVILKREDKLTDSLEVFLRAQALLDERHDLAWLQPFGFENTYVIAMRAEQADRLGVSSLSELGAHAAQLRGGFSLEFLERPDGFTGLAEHYGLELAEVRGMEHALAYAAIDAGELDIVDAYSTDGKLLRFDLRLLADDRGYFPPYDAAPLVRGELIRRRPGVRKALERLAFRVNAKAMTALNHAVEEEGREISEVARSFLVAEGLIEGEHGALPPAKDTPRDTFVPFFLARWRTTLELTLEHIGLTALAVLLAALFAVPLGLVLVRHPRATRLCLGVAGVLQTIPSLALLAFMITVPGLGLSARSAVAALFLYALLPILKNTVTGLQSVSPEVLDAARGMGLRPREVLMRIRLPLAMPVIMAGLRIATVISVGVATLAAFIGAGGLGEPIVTGLYLNDTRLILAGALPAACLALLADAGLSFIERRVTPDGLGSSAPGTS